MRARSLSPFNVACSYERDAVLQIMARDHAARVAARAADSGAGGEVVDGAAASGEAGVPEAGAAAEGPLE